MEAKAQVKFRKIFNNIADDVSSLLLSTQDINLVKIAENYKPDFIGALRDVYRETIKTFGFSLRELAEKKYNLDFVTNLEKKKVLYNLEVKQDFEVNDSQEQQINRELLTESTLFINNRSEIQADTITATNAKEIDSNINKSVKEYDTLLATNVSDQQKLTEEISTVSIAILLGTSTEKDRAKLERELTKLTVQETTLTENRNKIVSRNFKKNFKERGVTRSELISEFEVGQTESFIRQEEAETLDNVVIAAAALKVMKNWDATLDKRTREAHVIADATYHFNPIPVTEAFYVGGERLQRPRDPNGSAGNIIRCRCISSYSLA